MSATRRPYLPCHRLETGCLGRGEVNWLERAALALAGRMPASRPSDNAYLREFKADPRSLAVMSTIGITRS
jgi:hypothetical protein